MHALPGRTRERKREKIEYEKSPYEHFWNKKKSSL
jgi:hypothetical protein